MIIGLTEESGEVAGLLKRQNFKHKNIPMDRWQDELGDVFWYLLAICNTLSISIEDVWNYNLKKLEERYGKESNSI